MIPLGLSAADAAVLLDTLADHHSIRVGVQLLTLDGARVADLSKVLIDGQVNVDSTATPTRTLTMSLLDPTHALTFDSDSPADGSLFLDRMIRVTYSVKVPTGASSSTTTTTAGAVLAPAVSPFVLTSASATFTAGPTTWVHIPVFTGPVTKLDRDDDVVNLEAGGKELLAMGQAWRPLTIKRGTRKVDAVQTIMSERAGETKFSMPSTTARLPADVSLGRESVPWHVAKVIARGMSRVLFYDGRGVLWMRPDTTNVAFSFADGDGGTVTSAPQVSYSLSDNLHNIVWVKGKTTAKISAYAVAPRAHPLSPWRLGRTNADGVLVPRWLLSTVDDETIRTNVEARKAAQSLLDASLLESVDVSFDALPLPMLDIRDVCRLETDGGGMLFRARAFSIPLSTSSAMSVGVLKRVSVRPRRIRRVGRGG